MKKNEKLQAVLAKNLQNTLNSIKDAKSSTSKASKEEAKPKTKKVTNKKKETKVKEIPTSTKVKEIPTSTKAKVTKEVAKQQAASIKEKVVTERDVKYLYPADCVNQLARKKWRQTTRNEYRRLEREVFKFQGDNSKEAKEAIKKFEDFKKDHLKPGVAI